MPTGIKKGGKSPRRVLAGAKSLSWSELNLRVEVSAMRATKLFGVSFENFVWIAKCLGIYIEGRKARERWLLDLFDLLRISLFIYFFNEARQSEKDAAESANEIINTQKSLHSYFKKYQLQILIDPHVPLSKDQKEQARIQHEKAFQVNRFFADHLKLGWGTALRMTMLFNKDLIDAGLQWITKLEHREFVRETPDPESIYQIISKG